MKKILLIITMLALSAPVFAFEVYSNENMKFDFYGSIRLVAAYKGIVSDSTTSGGVTTYDKNDETFTADLQPNSRFGVKFRIYDLYGTVELSTSNETGNNENSRYRLVYATYDFKRFGKLSVGKMELPGTSHNGNIYPLDTMGGYGAITVPRRAAISYSIYGVGLYIVSQEADRKYFDALGSLVGNSATNRMSVRTQPTFPTINLSYNLPKVVGGQVYGSFSQMKLENSRDTNQMITTETDVIAWHVGGYVRPKFADFSVSVSGFYGVNLYLNGNTGGGFRDSLTVLDDNNLLSKVRDAVSWGVLVAPEYQIFKWFAVEVGFGYQQTFIKKTGVEKADTERNAMAAYAQLRFQPVEYVRITPQVGYYMIDTVADTKATSTNNLLFAGVQVRLDF